MKKWKQLTEARKPAMNNQLGRSDVMRTRLDRSVVTIVASVTISERATLRAAVDFPIATRKAAKLGLLSKANGFDEVEIPLSDSIRTRKVIFK